MPTPLEIREGLAANLGTIPDVQVSPYMLGNPSLPSIQIFPDEVDYDAAMGRGLDTWQIIIQAFVGLASDIGGQKRLDTMLAPSGAGSVKAAAESDRTLGGKVNDLRVVSASGYKIYSLPGKSEGVLGCEWTVSILATGT